MKTEYFSSKIFSPIYIGPVVGYHSVHNIWKMPGSECLGELLLGELEAQIQIDPSRYFHFQPLQIAAADWGAATTVKFWILTPFTLIRDNGAADKKSYQCRGKMTASGNLSWHPPARVWQQNWASSAIFQRRSNFNPCENCVCAALPQWDDWLRPNPRVAVKLCARTPPMLRLPDGFLSRTLRHQPLASNWTTLPNPTLGQHSVSVSKIIAEFESFAAGQVQVMSHLAGGLIQSTPPTQEGAIQIF